MEKDASQTAHTALEQYPVVEAIVKHLDLDSALRVSSLSKLWGGCARRRIAESRVKHGVVDIDSWDEKLPSLCEDFAGASLVLLFGKALQWRHMDRLLKALQSREERLPLLVGVKVFRVFPYGSAHAGSVSWVALPAAMPVHALSEAEFFDPGEAGRPARDVAMLLTSQMFCPPEKPAKRRKLSEEVRGQIVGGVFAEVLCNHAARAEMQRVDFLAVCLAAIPQRIEVEFGETSSQLSDLERSPHLSCAVIFPCAAVAGRRRSEFLGLMRRRFPRSFAVVGGFTGGEWFGRFTAQDFSEAQLLFERVRHAYSCFYIAFVCR